MKGIFKNPEPQSFTDWKAHANEIKKIKLFFGFSAPYKRPFTGYAVA